MAKQTFTTGQVLTAAQMTSLQATSMGGGSPSVKTTSYVLVAADAGTVIQMNSASSTTITVNTSLFSAGDSVQIQNIGAGTMTITAGTATVNSAGSLAVTQYDGGFLYFSSASSAIWFDYTQPGTTSPLTTKGDLYTRTSSADSRLPVGANGTTLVADSAEATGLKWATASSGGITLISETVASALSSLSLSSIPNTYKDLVLTWHGIFPSATAATGFFMRFNNNSAGGTYRGTLITSTGSATTNQSFSSTDISHANTLGSAPFGWYVNDNSDNLTNNACGSLTIYNYASTSKFKLYETQFYFTDINGTKYSFKVIANFASTTAISSIDIIRDNPNATFSNGSNTSIRLYGVS